MADDHDNLDDLIEGLFSGDDKSSKDHKDKNLNSENKNSKYADSDAYLDALLNRTPKSESINPSEFNSTNSQKRIEKKISEEADTQGGFKDSGSISLNELSQDNKTYSEPVPEYQSPPIEEDRSKYENTSTTDLTGNAKFDPDAYNRYSAAVDEIMNYIPNWLIRWGNTLICVIIGTILLFSYLLKYPDVIKGSATMTTTNPPVAVYSKSEGEIDLLFKDNDIVNKGDVIAVIERDASYDDIQFLKSVILRDPQTQRSSIISDLSSRPLRLGAVQQAYSNYYSKVQNSVVQGNEFSTNNDRIRKYEEQIALTNRLIQQQQDQVAQLEAEYNLAQSVVKERYQPMYSSGSISREALERKIQEANDKYNRLQESRKRLSEYDKSIIDIQSQIQNMKFSNSRITNTVAGDLTDAVASLNNSIVNWEHSYLIKAPTAGELSFANFLKDLTYVRREQELAYIVPEVDASQDSIYAEVMLDGKGSGRLEEGQTVFIELDAYPKKQYGRLEGILVYKADVATEMRGEKGSSYVYEGKVALPDGFQSTTGKEIIFKPNMRGSAEVITKDVRLIQRLFDEINNAFDY